MSEVVTENKAEQAGKIIRNYSLGSVVPSLLPVPMLDLAVVTGVQLKMLHSLAQNYGVEFKEEFGRSAIASLVGGTMALSAARVASSAVKAVPGIGSLIGAATMPVVNGGTTYAIGQVFKQHFESGGTFLTFDAAKVREYFEQQLKEGKAVVAAAQASGEVPKDAAGANAKK
ncbi:MAG TPA: DUF697 domain-containing protein [Rhodocyclaceae bacterium]|nr:DUF697 domain-containing protein [Rhodocyclaceae bacterium]